MNALAALQAALALLSLAVALHPPLAFSQSSQTPGMPIMTDAIDPNETTFTSDALRSSPEFSPYYSTSQTMSVTATGRRERREYRLPEVESFCGFYNNRAHPDWGRPDGELTRRCPSAYRDGVYMPAGGNRPNPLAISMAVMKGPKGLLSYKNRSVLLTFYGQQVVEEILDAQRAGCPPEYLNMKVPRCHPVYDKGCTGKKVHPFIRTGYAKNTGQSPGNPREQKNEITPWFDGTLFYGPSKAWSDALRSFRDGKLACSDSTCQFPQPNTIGLPFANPPPPANHFYKRSSRFFKIGNPRGNENPMVLTMGIIWFRNHNWHANRLKREFDAAGIEYNDEILFNRARQWTIAEHQHITLNHWLPSLLSEPPSPYTGYKPGVHPGVTHAFQSAAMRFGHTLVPPFVHRAYIINENDPDRRKCEFRPISKKVNNGAGQITAIRTCNSYWNSPDIIQEGHGIEELILGMSKQVTEREDHVVTEDLRGFVFGPLEFSRRDLMAINIQRGRDHGLPDYNTARATYGLPRIKSFDDINPNAEPGTREAIWRLAEVYNNDTNNIDMWPGGLLETTPNGPGPLFSAVIRDQFERIRDGDRFWFNNTMNGLFTDAERATILNTTFRDVLNRVAMVRWWQRDFLQEDVFHFDSSEWPNCRPTVRTPEELEDLLDDCTVQKTFDYFSGSAGPFIGSFVAMGCWLLLMVGALYSMVRYQKWQRLTKLHTTRSRRHSGRAGRSEWERLGVIMYGSGGQGPVIAHELKVTPDRRQVIIGLTSGNEQNGQSPQQCSLTIHDALTASEVRRIDLSHITPNEKISIVTTKSSSRHNPHMLIRTPHHSDILLEFADGGEGLFRNCLIKRLHEMGLKVKADEMLSQKEIVEQSFTERDHQELVNEFFRIAFQEVTGTRSKTRGRQLRKLLSRLKHRDTRKKERLRQVYEFELTKSHFAAHVGMKPTNVFVEQLFRIVDKDGSGRVTFEEFIQFITLLIHGTEEEKATMLFDLYDIDGNGTVDLDELYKMLMLSAQGERLIGDELKTSVETLLKAAGLEGKTEFTSDNFQTLFVLHRKDLEPNDGAVASSRTLPVVGGSSPSEHRRLRADLDHLKKKKVSIKAQAPRIAEALHSQQDEVVRPTIEGDRTAEDDITKHVELTWKSHVLAFVDTYRRQIFWATLYTLVLLLIFVERAYYYSVEREHVGLRRIAGYGVTVTRGAASAMMFTYSSLLVTMCRNLIRYLRETPLNKFIPFDSAVAAHKFFAYWALLFTIVHCIGHSINFYHISTQPRDDLVCLFRNYMHLSHELPKFQFWLWNTITGVTGFLLVVVVVTMYVFAIQYSRKYLFKTFWLTHHLYIALYALIILHGSGRLVQPPIFQWFFIGPAALFAIDKLISVSRNRIELKVVMCEKLPSNVTHIRVDKPMNFDYKSGQWARIAVLSLNDSEYHPFTITSAPHERHVDFYIRAVGPWTQAVRTEYDPDSPLLKHNSNGDPIYPPLYLDGPYGEGHQEWYKYPVAVLVGGGIGVTPFASIMKDLVHMQSIQARFATEKVYFLWVTRTQKQFEWMTDIIREVEEQDLRGLLDVHVFITQFYQKFDLRTCMLYICERHFHKVSHRSLFTGLRSETHFGRPDFCEFFKGIKAEHHDVGTIGVFSCGPPPMTRSVEKAAAECNLMAAANSGKEPRIDSHSENF